MNQNTLEVFVGDTVPLVISWFSPSLDTPNVDEDAILSEAIVRVIRNKDRGVVIDNETASINDNETFFVVPTDKTTGTGSYTAFVTATFQNGSTITKDIHYYVKSK